MEKNNEVVLTVREWAEKSGLKLYNYDGFLDIYSKLSGDENGDFESHMINRYRNAGDLLCTRKAFESCLFRCTMKYPDELQYEQMADVIPEFVEGDINMKIAFSIGQLKHYQLEGDELRKAVEKMLNLLKQKANIRQKNIEVNKDAGEVDISELDETGFNPEVFKIIKAHEGTVENLEEKLSNEVIESLENLIQKSGVEKSDIPLQKIEVLSSLLYGTGRQKTNEKIEEEFMYLNMPGMKKEQFEKTYNIIDGEKIRSGVAFDVETEKGRVKGAMPTTPEVDKKIREATGESANPVLSKAETSRALEVIDSEVAEEERRSFKTRIKEFLKKMVDKIKGKNEGR